MSLRYTVLALLTDGPNTGYGIGRLLEHQLSHLWGARLQQIYRELSKLEAGNFVEAERVALLNRPAKKIYTITPAGNKALDKWLNEPPVPLTSKSDMLLKVYCLKRLPKEVIVRRLEERQAEYEKVVRDLREKLTEARRADQLGYQLTLEAALAQAKGQASWCAKAVVRIRGEGDVVSLPQSRPARSRSRTAARASRA